MKRLRYVVPLVLFLALTGFLYAGLHLKPSEVPSPLIDKPAPAFQLSTLHEPEIQFTPQEMRGKVWLFNVWASWCVSCRQEHPVLMELARTGIVPIYGLDYKDQRNDGIQWLAQHGNPYVLSAYDIDGRVGINYGVYGVPETYLIDQQGIIRYKHIGPISRQALREKILPMVKELRG